MKKPNITEGEWKIEEYSDGSIGVSCDNHMVCEVNDAFRQITPNAQAISAVPDMIDALIGLIFMHRKHYGLDGAWDKELKNAEEALEKAGVEI